MHSRWKAIAAAVAVGLVTTLAPTVVARAEESGEIQDLRRQVSQMRAEMQALQLALAETTELERQRVSNLTRALGEPAAPAESGEPAAAAPPAPAAPDAISEGKTRKSSRHHHHRHASRSRSRDR